MTPEERAAKVMGDGRFAGDATIELPIREAIASEIYLAIGEEREACAKVAEDRYSSSPGQEAGTEIAAAIRKRGEK